jgi:hypothetical protein
MLGVPCNPRFSIHCPSPIAACFRLSRIPAFRDAPNFLISLSAFLPRVVVDQHPGGAAAGVIGVVLQC